MITLKTYFSFEQVFVVVHSVPVGESPDFILQHFLMNSEMGVRVEVIVAGGHFLRRNGLIRPYTKKKHGNSSMEPCTQKTRFPKRPFCNRHAGYNFSKLNEGKLTVFHDRSGHGSATFLRHIHAFHFERAKNGKNAKI